MTDPNSFPWQQETVIRHSQRLLNSFLHWTGVPLLEAEGTPEVIAEALFDAPFVVVSHGTEADPILNYGNRSALTLWEMDWQELTRTPSRYTAESIEREERAKLLEQARKQGYIDHYRGIRISKTGTRFQIENALIWDVLDEQGDRCGQAATFAHWTQIPAKN
jgi:hypothetical protein